MNEEQGTRERDELNALGFEVPDSVTPVVAYRSWHMRSTLYIQSHNGAIWTPGEPFQAVCPYRRIDDKWHEAQIPAERCTCGVYAAKRKDVRSIVPWGDVYGEVYLWGKIVEGGHGYRAEFCYPKRFYVRDKKTKVILERMGYGVPITVVGGAPGLGFPFPPSAPQRFLGDIGKGLLFINGVSALAMAAFTLTSQDMSKAINQFQVALLATGGVLAIAVTAWTRQSRRTLRRVHRHRLRGGG